LIRVDTLDEPGIIAVGGKLGKPLRVVFLPLLEDGAKHTCCPDSQIEDGARQNRDG